MTVTDLKVAWEGDCDNLTARRFLYGDNERTSWPSLSVFIIIFQFSTMNLLPGTKNSHSLLWEHFP